MIRPHTGLMTPDPRPPVSRPRRWLVPLAATAVVLGVLDALWISLVARGLYEDGLGDLLADPVVGWAAGVFYVVYAVAVTVLVVRPELDTGTTGTAAAKGAVLGVAAYATFGFTDLAIVEGWPVRLAVVDTVWGGVLTAATGAAAHAASRRAGA